MCLWAEVHIVRHAFVNVSTARQLYWHACYLKLFCFIEKSRRRSQRKQNTKERKRSQRWITDYLAHLSRKQKVKRLKFWQSYPNNQQCEEFEVTHTYIKGAFDWLLFNILHKQLVQLLCKLGCIKIESSTFNLHIRYYESHFDNRISFSFVFYCIY